MSDFKDYKMTIGSESYVLNSCDGGRSGAVFGVDAARNVVSSAYLYDDHDKGVKRLGKLVAGPGEFTVDLESGVAASDDSKYRESPEAMFNRLMSLLAALEPGYEDDYDDYEDCGECPACVRNAAADAAAAQERS